MTLATHFRQLAQRDKADLLMALCRIAAGDREAETALRRSVDMVLTRAKCGSDGERCGGLSRLADT